MKKVTQISEHKKYISRFPSIKLPKSFMAASDVLGLPSTGTPNAFYLKRRKDGVEIWIRFAGRFALNASAHYGIHPKSFTEARGWILDFSLKHGLLLSEIKGKFRDLHKL